MLYRRRKATKEYKKKDAPGRGDAKEVNIERCGVFFIWKEFKNAPQGTNAILGIMRLHYVAGLALIIVAR